MANYRITRTLSVQDAGYLAGIIDGEGTVTLSRRHRGDHRQLVVSVSSTELPILEYLSKATGVGKITGKRTCSRKHAKSFTWSISNRQALTLLEQIAPLLKSYKHQRAQLIEKHYLALTPRNGKYTPEMLAARNKFCRDVLAIKANAKCNVH